MYREALPNSRQTPNFIGSWIVEPSEICDRLVRYFEENVAKQAVGSTITGVDTAVKNSVDISILPNELEKKGNEALRDYFDLLFQCHKDYLEQWPFFQEVGKELEIGQFNLQRYKSGGHFQKEHTERDGID